MLRQLSINNPSRLRCAFILSNISHVLSDTVFHKGWTLCNPVWCNHDEDHHQWYTTWVIRQYTILSMWALHSVHKIMGGASKVGAQFDDTVDINRIPFQTSSLWWKLLLDVEFDYLNSYTVVLCVDQTLSLNVWLLSPVCFFGLNFLQQIVSPDIEHVGGGVITELDDLRTGLGVWFLSCLESVMMTWVCQDAQRWCLNW